MSAEASSSFSAAPPAIPTSVHEASSSSKPHRHKSRSSRKKSSSRAAEGQDGDGVAASAADGVEAPKKHKSKRSKSSKQSKEKVSHEDRPSEPSPTFHNAFATRGFSTTAAQSSITRVPVSVANAPRPPRKVAEDVGVKLLRQDDVSGPVTVDISELGPRPRRAAVSRDTVPPETSSSVPQAEPTATRQPPQPVRAAVPDVVPVAQPPSVSEAAPGYNRSHDDEESQVTPATAAAAPIKKKRRRGPKKKKSPEDEHVLTDPSSEDESGPLLARVKLPKGHEGGFDEEVQRLFDAQKASPEALAAREYLISELEAYLNREHFRWGVRHSSFRNPIRIEAFGSVRFGLATSTSDLDLCMFDPYRPNGFEDKYFSSSRQEVKRLPDIYDMRVIARKLHSAGISHVHPIPSAGVPIVKFEVQIGNERIQADINTNERLGVLNSRLINAYCELHPFIRPLCVLVKFYTKARGLNDPSGAKGPVTFSSYTLILMVIAYLQNIDFLPNLQDPDLIAQHGVTPRRFFSTPKVRWRRGQMTKLVGSVGWDVTFVEELDDWNPPPTTLRELARGFFDYYGETFDPQQNCISIQNGAPSPRAKAYVPESNFEKEILARKNGKQSLQGGEMSAEEMRRQENEDAVLEAFAEERAKKLVGDEDGPNAGFDLLHGDQDDGLEENFDAQDQELDRASRSSSPVAFENFHEPERWATRLLVVQDPFDLTRNTSNNVDADLVELLRAQFRRARDLIDQGESIDVICSSIKNDPDYVSLAEQRRALRKVKTRAERLAHLKTQKMLRKKDKGDSSDAGGPEVTGEEGEEGSVAGSERGAEDEDALPEDASLIGKMDKLGLKHFAAGAS